MGAVNQLVLDLKAASLWSKLGVIYPMVGGTAARHALNLKAPGSFTGAFTGGWVHSATGAKPNGTNGMMDTGYRLDLAGLNPADTHWATYIRTPELTSMGCAIGNGPGNCEVLINWTGGAALFADWPYFPHRLSGTVPGVGHGLFSGGCDATTLHAYKNGTVFASAAASLSAIPHEPHSITLGVGYLMLRWSSQEQAFASFGNALTAANHAALDTAVQTYQTTLGRQV